MRLFALVLLLLTGLAPAAHAQVGPATDYVDWTVAVRPDTVAPGGAARIDLAAAIADGWKMYALDSPAARPVQVRFSELPAPFTAAAAEQGTPRRGYDENFKAEVTYFVGRADFEVPVAVAADAEPGLYVLEGRVEFMICNDALGLCLPPTRVPFGPTVQVAEGGATSAPSRLDAGAIEGAPEEADPFGGPSLGDASAGAGGAGVAAAASDFAAARAGGLWRFLLLAMGAGLAALLTPCVFPMIPLTVSYFTKHADNRREAAQMATVYGLAIVTTFTGLGLLMALFVGAAGAQTIAANPWINLFLATVLVVFGLSLLGLFELRVPNGVLNYFNRQSHERSGYVGVLFMGLTLTLVSFSCTVPFVGGLLAATAGGEWAYPVLGMLTFSIVFALPFVVFALFPRGLQALPRSGAWMNAVKVTLGFVELAAAIKFLSNVDLVWGWGVVSRPLAIAVTAVLFFLTGLYLIGKLPLAHEAVPERVGVVRLLFSVLFFGVSLYMLPGLLGAPLGRLDAYLPPRMASDVSLLAALPAAGEAAGDHEEGWYVDDIEGAFAEARAAGKPVFVDFTGYTCTNCREMEANVFPRPEVASRFRRDFVLLRLYTDDLERGRDFQRYQLDLTGTVALPTYAIVHPTEERVLERLSGLASTERFVAFLERGARTFEANLAAR